MQLVRLFVLPYLIAMCLSAGLDLRPLRTLGPAIGAELDGPCASAVMHDDDQDDAGVNPTALLPSDLANDFVPLSSRPGSIEIAITGSVELSAPLAPEIRPPDSLFRPPAALLG